MPSTWVVWVRIHSAGLYSEAALLSGVPADPGSVHQLVPGSFRCDAGCNSSVLFLRRVYRTDVQAVPRWEYVWEGGIHSSTNFAAFRIRHWMDRSFCLLLCKCDTQILRTSAFGKVVSLLSLLNLVLMISLIILFASSQYFLFSTTFHGIFMRI